MISVSIGSDTNPICNGALRPVAGERLRPSTPVDRGDVAAPPARGRKKIYRLLVRHQARHFWNCQNPPKRRWFTGEKHRGFTGRMLAQFALANGWTEGQTAILLEAWRHRHGLPLHDAELRQMLAAAMKATAGLRRAFSDTMDRQAKNKTSYRILEFLTENGPATPCGGGGRIEGTEGESQKSSATSRQRRKRRAAWRWAVFSGDTSGDIFG